MCFTLLSASIAENAHGDESAATSTPLDAATMPLLSPQALFDKDVASQGLLAVSSTPVGEPLPTASTTNQAIALNNSEAPSGSTAKNGDQIISYTVQSGDTLSGIASHFHISLNTIVWANNINPKTALKEGQVLVILPISGVEYTVKAGDNLQSIANKFKGDVDEIVAFNNLQDSEHVKAGDVVVIPDGDMSSSLPKTPPKTSSSPVKNPSSPSTSNSNSSVSTPQSVQISNSSLIRPVVGGTETQGIHGHNAVDLASSLNTPIIASADGTVIVAKSGGWNGGYGTYVVIDHHNGVQTLYAHMNSLNTGVGASVSQGQTIGYMGETGDATGVHLHFEVRGAANPF